MLDKEEKLSKKVDAITKKYNHKAQPRYMSPTFVAKNKVEHKQKKILDHADKPDIKMTLR